MIRYKFYKHLRTKRFLFMMLCFSVLHVFCSFQISKRAADAGVLELFISEFFYPPFFFLFLTPVFLYNIGDFVADAGTFNWIFVRLKSRWQYTKSLIWVMLLGVFFYLAVYILWGFLIGISVFPLTTSWSEGMKHSRLIFDPAILESNSLLFLFWSGLILTGLVWTGSTLLYAVIAYRTGRQIYGYLTVILLQFFVLSMDKMGYFTVEFQGKLHFLGALFLFNKMESPDLFLKICAAWVVIIGVLSFLLYKQIRGGDLTFEGEKHE